MNGPVSNEELVAFLDGELDPVRGAEVEALLNVDPDLADRAERLARQDEWIRDAFAPIVAAPIPAAMQALLSEQSPAANVVSLAEVRNAKAAKVAASTVTTRRWGWPQMGAIAASLVVGLVTGPLLISGGDTVAVGEGSLIVASATGPALPPALANMLNTTPSGRPVALAGLGTAQVDISFRAQDAALCRQVHVSQAQATTDFVACRGGAGDWQVEALGLRAATGGEMRTASGEAAPVVTAAVDAIIAGDPLVGDAEAAALRR